MMTTTQEKLTDRVWLLAFGAVHWRACMGEKDLSDVHEILVEEFARAKATGEPLEELRAYLAERGVSVSEHVAASESTEALETSQHPYVRRANNQVSVGNRDTDPRAPHPRPNKERNHSGASCESQGCDSRRSRKGRDGTAQSAHRRFAMSWFNLVDTS